MGLGAGFQGGCTKVLGKGAGAMAPVARCRRDSVGIIIIHGVNAPT